MKQGSGLPRFRLFPLGIYFTNYFINHQQALLLWTKQYKLNYPKLKPVTNLQPKSLIRKPMLF